MTLITALLIGGPIREQLQAQMIEASGDIDPFPPHVTGAGVEYRRQPVRGEGWHGNADHPGWCRNQGPTAISAKEAGSNGTVTVTGKDSNWNSAGLTVGERGTGRLIIQDQAQVVSRDGTLGGGIAAAVRFWFPVSARAGTCAPVFSSAFQALGC